MRKSFEVLSFGEVLWDLLPSGPALGGAPANLAVRLQGLGDDAWLASRVGQDRLGHQTCSALTKLGLKLDLVQTDPSLPTGSVQVTLDHDRQPHYLIIPGVAYDQIAPEETLLATAARCACLCFGTLAQRSAQNRLTLERVLAAAPEAVRFLDLNLRQDCYTTDTIQSSLRAADILKLNEGEAEYLAGLFGWEKSLPEIMEKLSKLWELSVCVVTLGERGVLARSADGHQVYRPGYPVALADPCGAGDAFSAGFLHEYLRGRPLLECCRLGNCLGAIVASQKGATEKIDPGEIVRLSQCPVASRVFDHRFAAMPQLNSPNRTCNRKGLR